MDGWEVMHAGWRYHPHSYRLPHPHMSPCSNDSHSCRTGRHQLYAHRSARKRTHGRRQTHTGLLRQDGEGDAGG